MNQDKTKGAKAALEAFYRRIATPKKSSTRRNNRPEKEVERACVDWMRTMNWSGQVYESKAKLVNGVWRKAGMKFGTCDWQGNTESGFAAYVEFKAPGKRSTFNAQKNQRQQNYIKDKINANAFACVVDNVSLLSKIYYAWRELRAADQDAAKAYLVSMLP